MTENRILFPRDELTVTELEGSRSRGAASIEAIELSQIQKTEVIRKLAADAPDLIPRTPSGARIAPEHLPRFLQILAELRKSTKDKSFGPILDRLSYQTTLSRNSDLPVWLFRSL
jgi:hypothetical protein